MTRLLSNWLATASLLRVAAGLAALAAFGAQAEGDGEIECPGYWIDGVCFDTPPGTDLSWPPVDPPDSPPMLPPDDPCPPAGEPRFRPGIVCPAIFPGLLWCSPPIQPPDGVCAN